jgi:hypothetical protein
VVTQAASLTQVRDAADFWNPTGFPCAAGVRAVKPCCPIIAAAVLLLLAREVLLPDYDRPSPLSPHRPTLGATGPGRAIVDREGAHRLAGAGGGERNGSRGQGQQ